MRKRIGNRELYNYETGGMTGILEQISWESLKKKRKYNIKTGPIYFVLNKSCDMTQGGTSFLVYH